MRIIIISDDDIEQTTFDNKSLMAEKGQIGYGICGSGSCIDGAITKSNAKEWLSIFIKEFLK